MTNQAAWYPYAPDQDFGVRIAADQALLELVVTELDLARRMPPRPANKAPVATTPSGPLPGPGWTALMVRAGRGGDGPVTTATALEAAAEMGRIDD